MVTRLMSRLFSATEERDSELTEQVGNDIEAAKKNGVVDTEELKFEDKGDGKVAITDKENGEVTMAELNQEGQYELYPAEQSEQIEGFIHPEGDGVTPGAQVGAPDEHAEDHMTGEDVIAPNKEDGGLNPEAGHEARVDDSQKPAEDVCPECGKNPCECEKDENKEDEKKFSDPMSKFFAEVSGVAVDAPKTVEFIVDENGNPVRPVVAEASSEEATPVEAIEDKALAAVQSIQAAAAEAQAQILNAKSAPVENQEDLQEATFSQKESNSNDIVVSWIKGNMR